MQHHAFAGLAFALAPVRAALLRPAHKSGRVQLRLRPGVAPAKTVVAHQMLVEVLDVPAVVARPVQVQHPPRLGLRRALWRGAAETAVGQSRKPALLVLVAIAAKLPLRNAKQFARFQQRQLPPLPAAQHVPELLHPTVLNPRCPFHRPCSSQDQQTGQIVCYLTRTTRVLTTRPEGRLTWIRQI